MPAVRSLLDRFRERAVPGPSSYPWAHHHDGGRHAHHLVVTLLVHGNEHGTLPAGLRLIDALIDGSVVHGGRVTLALANPEAALQDRRFLDFDLNRAFAFVPGREGHEHTRARELRPLLDAADLLLDLHQTGTPTASPFWTFPWNPVFGHWARVLQAAPIGITRPPDQGFAAPDLKCIDEYVRNRGLPGICLELGARGQDPEQAESAYRSLVRTLDVIDAIAAGHTTLADEAASQPELTWYTTAHREAWGDPRRALRPGLENWSPVRAGEDLSAADSPLIQVERDGRVLFPKYPLPSEPRPAHLFHLATELPAHPDEVFCKPPRVGDGVV